MPTRQPSATTGKPKKPRLQVVVTEAVCAKVEALAEEKGWSVSRTCEHLIEAGLDSLGSTTPNPSTRPAAAPPGAVSEDEAMVRFQKVLELAKAAGVL